MQPQEDFCVGFDNGRPVGDYDGKPHFRGAISQLKVVAEYVQPPGQHPVHPVHGLAGGSSWR